MESFFHTLKTERVHHRVYAAHSTDHGRLFQAMAGAGST